MDPLANLNDITLAEPIGWWPLAWGWWLLIGLTLVLLIAVSRFIMGRRHRRKALVFAQKQIELVMRDSEPLQQIHSLNRLLKQTARHYYGAQHVNALHGERWLEWLQASLPSKHKPFFSQAAQHVVSDLYTEKGRAVTTEDAKQFATACQLWMAHVSTRSTPALQSELGTVGGSQNV